MIGRERGRERPRESERVRDRNKDFHIWERWGEKDRRLKESEREKKMYK